MVSEKWKSVGMGILTASVGAAVFGAVHYMILAPREPAGQLLGIPYSVIFPVILGIAGFIGAGFVKKDWMKDILSYGSAAAIGFGIALYANWISPTGQNTIRARAPATAVARAPMIPATTMRVNPLPAAGTASAGIKMI